MRPFLGWLAALAMASQVAVPAAAAAKLAACCCTHKGPAKCFCPVCEHGRQIASGIPCMKTCGSDHDAVSPLPILAYGPPLSQHVAPLPLPEPVANALPPYPDSPVIEVPTPPPLA